MKGFTKFCLILCGILVVLGCIGIGAGIAMGIEPSRILDLAHYPGKFASERLSVLDDIADIPALKGSNPTNAEEYYELENLERLEFDLSLCDLKIQTHEKDFIILEAENTGTTFQSSADNDTLYLEDKRKAPVTGRNMNNALRLTLYLPENAREDINIIIGAGKLTADCLNAEHITIETGVSELKIGTLQGEDIAISTGTCDWKVDFLSASEQCSIDVGVGDITLKKYEGANLNLNCGAGDIKITAVGKKQDYNYDLNCFMGTIHLNHQEQISDRSHDHEEHDEEHSGIGCHVNVDNQAGREIDIQCAAGNLELNFEED